MNRWQPGDTIWQSTGGGEDWTRPISSRNVSAEPFLLWGNNDDRHRYSQRFRTLDSDLQHYGCVYVATDGRGIVYGEPVQQNQR